MTTETIKVEPFEQRRMDMASRLDDLAFEIRRLIDDMEDEQKKHVTTTRGQNEKGWWIHDEYDEEWNNLNDRVIELERVRKDMESAAYYLGVKA
jgi:hypothetical protein